MKSNAFPGWTKQIVLGILGVYCVLIVARALGSLFGLSYTGVSDKVGVVRYLLFTTLLVCIPTFILWVYAKFVYFIMYNGDEYAKKVAYGLVALYGFLILAPLIVATVGVGAPTTSSNFFVDYLVNWNVFWLGATFLPMLIIMPALSGVGVLVEKLRQA